MNESIGIASQLAFGFLCRNMVRINSLLDQSLQLLMTGVQISSLDKIVAFVPFFVLDRHWLAVAGVKVVALLWGDFGCHV